MILAGDIGGTNTRIGLFPVHISALTGHTITAFPSGKYESLHAILHEFRENHPFESRDIHAAVFGVAGPVNREAVRTTNLNWTITRKSLEKEFGFQKVFLVNDLSAYACFLFLDDLAVPYFFPVNQAVLHQNQPVCLLAPGTGMGQAYMTFHPEIKRYTVHPSEGGHAGFSPACPLEMELYAFYMEKTGKQVTVETLCSGPGIGRIFSFLQEKKKMPVPVFLQTEIKETGDPAKSIVRAVTGEKSCEIAEKTMEVFVGILAGEARNLALKTLSAKGVYLGGGIPGRILSLFGRYDFPASFIGENPMSHLLEQMPVQVITHENAGLYGAYQYGRMQVSG